MYDTELPYTCLVKPFQSTYPQIQIRIHRILDKHRNIRILQRISYFLHQKRVGRRPGPDPDHIHTEFHAVENMLFACHLRADLHSQLVLYSLEPFEPLGSYAFECIRVSSRLPYSGTEHAYAQRLKSSGSFHYLDFGFCAARASYQERPPFIEQIEQVPFLQRKDV